MTVTSESPIAHSALQQATQHARSAVRPHACQNSLANVLRSCQHPATAIVSVHSHCVSVAQLGESLCALQGDAESANQSLELVRQLPEGQRSAMREEVQGIQDELDEALTTAQTQSMHHQQYMLGLVRFTTSMQNTECKECMMVPSASVFSAA